ncbi:MAG TPA: ATP-binding protein, partial [Candidatus Aquicultoraceae bacterium]|nr:ATP-binding protein [Candidatus Aquicultoraceae bacterium]
MNPFNFREVPADGPFCDREKELEDLVGYAKGRASVVLFSPRRYGKTSLVRRVQKRLHDEGSVTVYADFFGVTSVDDVASRFAKAVFSVIHGRESHWNSAVRIFKSFRPVVRYDERGGISVGVEPAMIRKGGEDLLGETLSSFGNFVSETGNGVHVALDEFQEIAVLKDSLKIEGIMRSHIQRQRSSYFFIGSRRRILLGMFNDRQRP